VNGSNVRITPICRMCKTRLSARSSAGTGHLLRHQKACRKKVDHAARVQSRLAFNPDGSLHNWECDPIFARTELCRLIARLDLPLGIGESQAWEDYIARAHNPRFTNVSRQTTTRDLLKLFTERRNVLINSVLPASSSIALTSDIWSSNAKEYYISVSTTLVLSVTMLMLIGNYRKGSLVLGLLRLDILVKILPKELVLWLRSFVCLTRFSLSL
jgi:hypothetical protein